MLTKTELATKLKRVNARDVAAEAGVSVKTIYRLRNEQTSPTLATVERLIAACQSLRKRKPAVKTGAQRDASESL